jgi:DNA-binding response OmpR family regulator
MRILLVEDDPDLLRFLQLVLRRRHKVRAFASGREALAGLAQDPPELLLSDLHLPDLPGEELARAVAQLEVPPVVLLFSGDHARLERARPLAAAILPKPFSIGDLERLLERLAPLARQKRATNPRRGAAESPQD